LISLSIWIEVRFPTHAYGENSIGREEHTFCAPQVSDGDKWSPTSVNFLYQYHSNRKKRKRLKEAAIPLINLVFSYFSFTEDGWYRVDFWLKLILKIISLYFYSNNWFSLLSRLSLMFVLLVVMVCLLFCLSVLINAVFIRFSLTN
jgi:hypothetical protein